jgi:arginyl-tRNA synthetase
VKALAAGKNFDYLCWDLYAKATQFFEEDKVRAGKMRGETLKAIEAGEGETAAMATLIADAVVGFHLRTMARLDIFYELLARESEILHLHFWDAAFEKLKASGAIQLATSGKNAGCWVMPWGKEVKEVKEGEEVKEKSGLSEGSASDDEKLLCGRMGQLRTWGRILRTSFGNLGCWGRIFIIAGGRILRTRKSCGPQLPGRMRRARRILEVLRRFIT